MKIKPFWVCVAAIVMAGLLFTGLAKNEYYYNAIYVILQATIMAVAWNILGGFTGYVNFGTAGFFAVGAYTSIALDKAWGAPLPVLILAGGAVCALIGLGVGYLTLRLKGVYFSIATLAMAIVFETLVNNWAFVGGAKGAYILTPDKHLWFDSYIEMLFMVMLLLAVACVAVSRALNSSRLGRGLAAIRDDEVAAECSGVPTLRLKLISTTVMGAMMGVAGAPYPFFVTFVDPQSAFNLFIAVNAIAMPMIGGTSHWLGPVIGALLVGTMQEIITVNVSSELNVLIVGVMLVVFITLAPQGIVGLVQQYPQGAQVMSGVVLQVAGLTKRFGGFVALQDVALHLDAGERLGLIGPNGSGKTTLINCISGALPCDGGTIEFEGRDITHTPPHRRARLGVARSFQIPKPFRSMSVLDNLRVPLEYAARSRSKHGDVADEAMELLGLIGLQHRAHASSASLTQVDMRKLELARALAAKPRLLVSDEAMAGLSSSEVDEILEILLALNRRGVAVIMIEHVMRVVMKFSERLVVLVAGRKIADGEPRSVAANADVVKAYLGE